MSSRTEPASLAMAFSGFYDLQRPGYLAYAAARLSSGEAEVAVACAFGLVAADWPTAMTRASPAAYAWSLHTAYLATRTGSCPSREEDAVLLYESLGFSVAEIATLTGADSAAVSAMLSAAFR